MTTVKEIVNHLQTQFQSYANRYSDELMYHSNAFTKYESDKTVRDLVVLLAARKHDEQEANETSLAFLIEFLENRWSSIMATQSMYNHSPLTLANRLCVDIAKQISAVTGVSRYAYLYPTLKNTLAAYVSENGDIDALEPWEFVFDNQWNPIDVLLALKLVRNRDNGQAIQTNLALREQYIDLESSTRVFACHANCVLWAYHPENRGQNTPVPDKLSAEEVADFDENSYGEAGVIRQSSMMGLESLSKFADMLKGEYEKLKKSRLEMKESEFSVLWRGEWEKIWKTFVTPDIRKKLISPALDDTFFQKLQSPSTYRKGDSLYNRAVLFCFTEYYLDHRTVGSAHTGAFAQTLSFLVSSTATDMVVAPKEKKLKAAGHFIGFLTSDYPLDGFSAYINHNGLETHSSATLQGYLTKENLPRIVEQASLIMSPNFFPQEAPKLPIMGSPSAEPQTFEEMAASQTRSVIGGQSSFFQPEKPMPQPPKPAAPTKSFLGSVGSVFGW